jgi:hypothetical protein
MNRIRFISALLVIMMLVGALASCGGGSEQIHNDSETADKQNSSEIIAERTEDTDETEKDTGNDTDNDTGIDTTRDTDSNIASDTESDTMLDEESDTEPTVELPIGKLNIENGAMIEYADYLASLTPTPPEPEPPATLPDTPSSPAQIAILIALCLLVPLLAALILKPPRRPPYEVDD